MPKFSVHLLQDAWVRHETVVEADTREQAAHMAYDAWKNGDESVKFEEVGAITFDHIEFPEIDEIEEVDDE